jgi:hypothetical protein
MKTAFWYIASGTHSSRQTSVGIKTQLDFGVDPFFYFERLAKNPDIPPMYLLRCDLLDAPPKRESATSL